MIKTAYHNETGRNCKIKCYPDQEKSIEGYREVFEKLLSIQPVNSDMQIVIETVVDDFDPMDIETYVDVSGKSTNPKPGEEAISYALEFHGWSEWLGMEVSPASLGNFSELECIAHCLFEMTFCGFDEAEIQSQWKDIENTASEIKNMTDEERKANTYSLEDILKMPDEEEEDDDDDPESENPAGD